MTPDGTGRFCNHCNKTVIDFTGWSDAALYRLFAAKKENLCGRFLTSQLRHELNIPHQPQSRLYRLVIGLGLTLLFTQIPVAKARNRPPIQFQIIQTTSQDTTGEKRDSVHDITGTITDNKREPLINASVSIYKHDTLIKSVVTDFDGRYVFNDLQAGFYTAKFAYTGYESKTITGIPVSKDETTNLDVVLSNNSHVTLGVITIMGRPAVNKYEDKKIFTHDKLKHLPGM
jgi:hypothetical protein